MTKVYSQKPGQFSIKKNETKVITAWPTAQVFNLGNFLSFRKEIELLASSRKSKKALLYFGNTDRSFVETLPYFREILFSSPIQIEPIFSLPPQQKVDWPPNDPQIARWSYGSFKRIAWLWEKTNLFPELLWPISILEKAKNCYNQYSNANKRKIFAIHLKKQQGGPEESNATMEEWEKLFSENSRILFLLLGDDVVPKKLFDLPNVLSAKSLGMSLATQFAFCTICDGFMGMATGICTAVILSHTPYAIFKHPKHHAKEMAEEFGNKDHFPFAQPKQKLLRTTDSIQNLRTNIEILL